MSSLWVEYVCRYRTGPLSSPRSKVKPGYLLEPSTLSDFWTSTKPCTYPSKSLIQTSFGEPAAPSSPTCLSLWTGGRHTEGNEHTQSTQRSCSYLRLWLPSPESTSKAELGAVWVGPSRHGNFPETWSEPSNVSFPRVYPDNKGAGWQKTHTAVGRIQLGHVRSRVTAASFGRIPSGLLQILVWWVVPAGGASQELWSLCHPDVWWHTHPFKTTTKMVLLGGSINGKNSNGLKKWLGKVMERKFLPD